MSKVWFIGDTHFWHKNIIKLCGRPFNNIEEMNSTLVKNWNKSIKLDDKVFMLGDFCLGSRDQIIEFGRQLNGRKTIILGNHDTHSRKTYFDAGFDYVSQYPILWNKFYILSHESQHVQANGVYANIFAHVHDNPEYADCSSRSFCVSAERINYTPIEFNEILRKMRECK